MPLFKNKLPIDAEQFTQAMVDKTIQCSDKKEGRMRGVGLGPFGLEVILESGNNYAAVYPTDSSERENWNVAVIGQWLIRVAPDDLRVVEDKVFREKYEPL